MTPTPVFPKGNRAPAGYFTGTVWLNVLVPGDATYNAQVAHVVFEPGARTHWHTHPGGQILVVTEGTGYYQEKGKSLRTIRAGEVVTIPPDLEHWHGASRESGLTHIAINTNAGNGAVVWLQPVTDEDYQA